MMKRSLLRWIAAALVMAPAATLAAIDNSHHDMSRYTPATAKAEKCAFCHSKVIAQGAALGQEYGQVGTFCVVVCHDGNVAAAAEPTSPGYFDGSYATQNQQTDPSVVAFDVSHGADVNDIINAALDPDNANGLGGTGWPHTSSTAGAVMECTSCHAVHDSVNPPFLNAKLSVYSGGAPSNTASFCQRCHTGADAGTTTAGRYEAISGYGAHPTEFVMNIGGTGTDEGNAGPAATPATNKKLGRRLKVKARLLVQDADTIIDRVTFDAPGNNWMTGGHFMRNETGAGADRMPAVIGGGANPAMGDINGTVFGCYSCHSAHQSDSGRVGSNLILADQNTGTASLFCAGCHGGTGSEDNPGLTTYYHPANAAAASPYQHDHVTHNTVTDPNIPITGSFPIPMSAAFTAIPSTYKGTTGEVLCITCHDVHGGVINTMAIRQIGGSVSATSSVCLACHQTTAGADQSAMAQNWHHPSGDDADYTATGAGAWNYANPRWITVDGLGNLADGMSCPDCHVFQATRSDATAPHRATAHNW